MLIAVAALLAVSISVIGQRAVSSVAASSEQIVAVTAKRVQISLQARAEFAGLRRDILLTGLADGKSGLEAQAAVDKGFTSVGAKLQRSRRRA